MRKKNSTIRNQFLGAINVVLIVILVLLGTSFWLEWGITSREHIDKIQIYAVENSREHLNHGFQMYDETIEAQIRQMEQLADNFGRSEEILTLIQKNRIDPLNHLLSVEADNQLIDFVTVFNVENDIVGSYPVIGSEFRLKKFYAQLESPIKISRQQLLGDPLSRKDRNTSSIIQVSHELSKELGIGWVNADMNQELALITVTILYTDFGDPVGLLVIGKLFRNMQAAFNRVKERTNLDFAIYSGQSSSVSTGLHKRSPLLSDPVTADLPNGPDDNSYYIQHHDSNLLCREIRLPESGVIGLECSGVSTVIANRMVTHIVDVLEDLKNTIGYWYILLGVTAIVCSTILAYFLSLRLTKPLEIVTRAIEKLARNDLEISLPKHSRSAEIETISDATEVFKQNIEKMKKVEGELRDQKEEAILSSQIKSQFLGNMGHDLRTPLNAIIGFSEVLAKEFYGDLGHEKYREYSKDIHFSGNHLLDLISNILVVSSIESGKFTMDESWFNLSEVVGQSIRLHQFLASQSSVVLTAQVSEELDEFYGDPLRFQQILNNLISNAIKFTPANGSVITDCYTDEKGNLTLKVTDTGAGINPELLNTIFEPFSHDDHKTITPQQGTGLGLFLVKKFAEFHDGAVTVESKIGEGTCFTLIIPAARLRGNQQNKVL